MTPLINERVDQPVNSGLPFLIMKSNKKYHKFDEFPFFYGPHSDFTSSEVPDGIYQSSVLFCGFKLYLFDAECPPYKPQIC